MLTTTPRYFGFPSQIYVRSADGLRNLVSVVDGKAPCWISVLRYPTPSEPIFDKMVFDFDCKELKVALADVNRLRQFAKGLGIEYTVVFSGKKGFHFYLHFKPTSITSYMLGAVHQHIAEQCKLLTIDPHVGRTLRQMIRMPTTKYMDKNNKANGHYCRVVSDSELDAGIATLLKVSKAPGELPKQVKPSYRFSTFISMLTNFNKRDRQQRDKERLKFESVESSAAITDLNIVVPACLRAHITDFNPIHRVRYETTCWLKLLCYSNTAIYDFYERLDWADWDRGKTRQQVRRGKPRPVWCSDLRNTVGTCYCSDCSIGEKNVLH